MPEHGPAPVFTIRRFRQVTTGGRGHHFVDLKCFVCQTTFTRLVSPLRKKRIQCVGSRLKVEHT